MVISECSSACTTSFIGGIERRLADNAKLGFHQYRIDAVYAVLKADPLQEQERDRALFVQSGVAAWFLDMMFDSHPSEIWYPEPSELLAANVVTNVAGHPFDVSPRPSFQSALPPSTQNVPAHEQLIQ